MLHKIVVQARDLVKTYRKGGYEIHPLDGVSLDVTEGEFVAVMGPSGSGKSTLLHIMGGVDRPDSGTCRVADVELSGMKESQLCGFRSANIGFVFQAFNLIPVLSAADNVELPLRLFSMTAERRRKQVKPALESVGLNDRADHFPAQLSGGQEQRVAIARALVTDPKLILADEPTGNLDADSSDDIVQILRRLVSEYNKTIIMVTHDASKAAIADRIFTLQNGSLTETNLNPSRS